MSQSYFLPSCTKRLNISEVSQRYLERDFAEDCSRSFNLFDHRGKEYITARDLKAASVDVGSKLSDEDIHALLKELDSSGTGCVSIEDFMAIVREAEELP